LQKNDGSYARFRLIWTAVMPHIRWERKVARIPISPFGRAPREGRYRYRLTSAIIKGAGCDQDVADTAVNVAKTSRPDPASVEESPYAENSPNDRNNY